MGVRGLTTFISNNSDRYLEIYELHDCYLVIDGNSIQCQLYKWYTKGNDCFGGDYDKYAQVIYKFFDILRQCNVTPIVIFDGGYEKRKLKTVYERMKNKVYNAKHLNGSTEGTYSVFPLHMGVIFEDIVAKLGIKHARSDFEGDSETACVAKMLGCPVLSYDSDYYIFDSHYIPFSTFDMRVSRRIDPTSEKNINYVTCKIYKIDRLLKVFGGLDKDVLPVLALLLGNDYIKKSVFSAFYLNLKVHKSRGVKSEQQRTIKTLIEWLKNETMESAIEKILSRFKMKKRKSIARKIEKVINGYNLDNCSCFKNLDLDFMPNVPKMREINVSEIEANIKLEGEEVVEEESEEEDEEEEGEENEVVEDEEEEKDEMDYGEITESVTNLKDYFLENFRSCVYPASFINLLLQNIYYCIPQVENHSLEYSHSVSIYMLGLIHRILSGGSSTTFTVVARCTATKIKKYTVASHPNELPCVTEIADWPKERCKDLFLNLLGIYDYDFIAQFPPDWQLYAISLKYWLGLSRSNLDDSFIYATVLSAIIANIVDKKIGFHRFYAPFKDKFPENKLQNYQIKTTSEPTDIPSAFNKITFEEAAWCMNNVIHYYQMNQKMRNNPSLYNRDIVHRYSEFQSCLLHVRFLNALLKFPFQKYILSDFYNGTFLYNMTVNFKTRTRIKTYLRHLLYKSPHVVTCLDMIVSVFEEEMRDMPPRNASMKKKKRRKKKVVVSSSEEEDESSSEEDDEEEVQIDSSNKFSLLSVLK